MVTTETSQVASFHFNKHLLWMEREAAGAVDKSQNPKILTGGMPTRRWPSRVNTHPPHSGSTVHSGDCLLNCYRAFRDN